MDSCISDHIVVMTAIEGIGTCLSALNDIIALSDASPARPSPDDVSPPMTTPPPVAPHPAGSAHMPIPPTWGHGFHPSAPGGGGPWVYRVEQGQDHFCCPYHERDGPAGRGVRGFDRDRAGRGCQDFDRDGRCPSPCERSICLDLHHCFFIPGVQCGACKRIGHEASSCDMLAIDLFLDKYIKHSLADNVRCTIESTWVDRWKKKLGQPQRSPTQVMKAYCDDLEISPSHLDLAMDWDCWPVDEYGNFTQGVHIDQE